MTNVLRALFLSCPFCVIRTITLDSSQHLVHAQFQLAICRALPKSQATTKTSCLPNAQQRNICSIPCVKTFSGEVWGWELPLFHFLVKASPELLDVKGLETHQRVAHNEFSCLFPWLPHWRGTALLCPSPLVKPKKRRKCGNALCNESWRVRLQNRKEHSCSGTLHPGFAVHIQEAGEWPKESHHTESDGRQLSNTQDTRYCSAGGLTINQQLWQGLGSALLAGAELHSHCPPSTPKKSKEKTSARFPS